MRPAFLAAVVVVTGLGAAAPLRGGVRVDVNRELRLLELGQTPPRHIPGAKYRVAVFAYEDPDHTGLGDSAAALVERAILTGSGVSSLGVLRYEGDLSPQRPGDLGYFDKVDRVVGSQDVSLAVWGRIARAGSRLLVDTYVQVPPATLETRFTWQLRLPREMGGDKLLARLRPNRFAIQRLQLAAGAADMLRSTAQYLDELRASPSDAAAISGRLPREQVYSLARRQGPWVLLQVRGGPGGWARLPACADGCGAFLGAASFAGGLLAYLQSGSPPPERAGLTPEALAVRDQLVLDSLDDPGSIEYLMNLPRRWSTRTAAPAAAAPGGRAMVPPSGAAANAAALAQLSLLLTEGFRAIYEKTIPRLPSLREAVREGRMKPPVGVGLEGLSASDRGLSPLDIGLIYDEVVLDRERLRKIAFDLADAAVLDPRNPELMHNMAVLFRRAGDAERATKAERLAEQATRR
jgi:hypothetical protein